GYTMATEQPFLKRTNLINEMIISNNTTNGLPSYIANTFKAHYGDEKLVVQRNANFFDGNCRDYGNLHQYAIMSGSVLAGENYYGGIDAIELNNNGPTASGAKLYARLLCGCNAVGDNTKV